MKIKMDQKEFYPTPYGLEGIEELDEDHQQRITSSSSCLFPSIPRPETPREPMEFLCRSWSVSASEICKALTQRPKQFLVLEETESDSASPVPDSKALIVPQQVPVKVASRKTGAFGKWFHLKELGVVKKKDRERVENARVHSAVTVAALAVAVASIAAEAAGNSSDCSSSKIAATALASATELLATHCVELAETVGADHDRLISAVRSAVDARGPSDLMTLTAAAATALRGEAAVRARIPKEAKKNAAISPCERASVLSETNEDDDDSVLHSKTEQPHSVSNNQEHTSTCVGELMQFTQNGVLRWKHVSVYINKKSQVIIKVKSKHVGGAFSMKNKGVVYEVTDEIPARRSSQERGSTEELFFGLKTAKGVVEFKCKNKAEKQKWVVGIRKLLLQVTDLEASESSLQSLCINDST